MDRTADNDPGGGGRSGYPLKLDALQRDLLLALIEAFAASAPRSAAGDAYAAIGEAAAAMEIPADLAAAVGSMVEVALATGRVRNLFGPGAELSLTALFRRMPRGAAIAKSLDELNRALAGLEGRPLSAVSAAFRKPGVYTLSLAVDGYRLVVRFDQDGATVESVETGAGL